MNNIPIKCVFAGGLNEWQFYIFYSKSCAAHFNIMSGPGLIQGSSIMMRHVSFILLLEWSTTSQRLWVYRISVPYPQKDPRFLFEKRIEFLSLVLTIDGSTLPQDCVEEQLC